MGSDLQIENFVGSIGVSCFSEQLHGGEGECGKVWRSTREREREEDLEEGWIFKSHLVGCAFIRWAPSSANEKRSATSMGFPGARLLLLDLLGWTLLKTGE